MKQNFEKSRLSIVFSFLLLPILLLAESKVAYNKELDNYIGTWVCVDNIPDVQWVPNKFEVKKKGKSIEFIFYKRSGKVSKDFYSGPYMYKGDGIFEWEALPEVRYYDSRPSQQNVFKYDFHTLHSDDGWGLRVTKWFYNESGEIDQQMYFLNFDKK